MKKKQAEKEHADTRVVTVRSLGRKGATHRCSPCVPFTTLRINEQGGILYYSRGVAVDAAGDAILNSIAGKMVVVLMAPDDERVSRLDFNVRFYVIQTR